MHVTQQVRSHVEVQIGMIAKGQADKDAVVAHTLQQFRQKFLFFVAKVARMESSGEDILSHCLLICLFWFISFHLMLFHVSFMSFSDS